MQLMLLTGMLTTDHIHSTLNYTHTDETETSVLQEHTIIIPYLHNYVNYTIYHRMNKIEYSKNQKTEGDTESPSGSES